MRAAAYYRKSTQDERKQHKDDKSVSVQTQRENARRYVEAQGWQLVGEWGDDNRSGADLTRPGFCAMLAAAERGEFDVLVVCDRERIIRHQTEGARVLERLTDAGCLVVAYDGTRIAWPGMQPEEVVVGQLTDFASAMLRKGARRRAREGLARAVEQGYHTGGPPPYGYRLVAERIVDARGNELPGPTKLVIDEEQARVIVALFKMCADGHGLTKCAKTVNGEERYAALNAQYFGGTLPPCPGYLISPTKYTKASNWCGTAIRAMYDNPIYCGRRRWGAMQNYERGGRVHLRRKQTDPDRVLLVDAPHLRIIPADLEARVKKRRKATAEHYARKAGGKFLFGRPESGQHSKFLLSGLLRCSVCNGAIVVTSYVKRGRRHSRYVCTRHTKRGGRACTNVLRVPLAKADGMMLAELQKLLTPERIEQVVQAAAERARQQRRERPEEADRMRTEIAGLRTQAEHFINAIGDGKAPAGVMARLHALEAQIAAKERLLEELSTAEVVSLGDARLMRVLRERLPRFRELLGSEQMPVARQALRRLLGDEVVWFTPLEGGGFELRAETRLGPLFEGSTVTGAGGGT